MLSDLFDGIVAALFGIREPAPRDGERVVAGWLDGTAGVPGDDLGALSLLGMSKGQ